MCPDLSVLLHVTKADVREWAARKGLKEGEYDIYPLAALCVPLVEKMHYQDYILAHFDEIKHPDLKDTLAIMLFDKERRSPSLIRHLKQLIASPESNAFFRGGMTAEEWQDLKKKVSELPEPRVGSSSGNRKAQP